MFECASGICAFWLSSSSTNINKRCVVDASLTNPFSITSIHYKTAAWIECASVDTPKYKRNRLIEKKVSQEMARISKWLVITIGSIHMTQKLLCFKQTLILVPNWKLNICRGTIIHFTLISLHSSLSNHFKCQLKFKFCLYILFTTYETKKCLSSYS